MFPFANLYTFKIKIPYVNMLLQLCDYQRWIQEHCHIFLFEVIEQFSNVNFCWKELHLRFLLGSFDTPLTNKTGYKKLSKLMCFKE